MTQTTTCLSGEVLPDRDAVMQAQGIAPEAIVSKRIERLYDSAASIVMKSSGPIAARRDVRLDEFAHIHHGEGRNEPRTPLEDIFPRADNLALFAVTLGSDVCEAIDTCFKENDFALGSMVDAVASAATDMLAAFVERGYLAALENTGETTPDTRVLRYSPGYCGWHISGQRKLFEVLRPELIGISLRESFLMNPLKSISGVLVAGHKDIHGFAPSYPFCRQCTEQSCRERLFTLDAQ